jgi:hypothetical protein
MQALSIVDEDDQWTFICKGCDKLRNSVRQLRVQDVGAETYDGRRRLILGAAQAPQVLEVFLGAAQRTGLRDEFLDQ